MKILAFAASSSRQSINKRLVEHAAEILKNDIIHDADIDLIDLNEFEMPIYSIDREREIGIPAEAHTFFDKITHADAVLVSYAEHNGTYTTAFKNIFDWASRIEMRVFQDKPVVMMSASIGKHGGEHVLTIAKESAPYFGAQLKASFSVGLFAEVFDSRSNSLVDAELVKILYQSLETLKQN